MNINMMVQNKKYKFIILFGQYKVFWFLFAILTDVESCSREMWISMRPCLSVINRGKHSVGHAGNFILSFRHSILQGNFCFFSNNGSFALGKWHVKLHLG